MPVGPAEPGVLRADPSLEDEAEELLLGVNELGSEAQLAHMWTSVYGLMEKK